MNPKLILTYAGIFFFDYVLARGPGPAAIYRLRRLLLHFLGFTPPFDKVKTKPTWSGWHVVVFAPILQQFKPRTMFVRHLNNVSVRELVGK